jgi:hypothetical protein
VSIRQVLFDGWRWLGSNLCAVVYRAVDDNESIMFDKWLTDIHDKYENDKLNHFEHNLEVWRELWRVTERATHVRGCCCCSTPCQTN